MTGFLGRFVTNLQPTLAVIRSWINDTSCLHCKTQGRVNLMSLVTAKLLWQEKSFAVFQLAESSRHSLS